MSTLPLERLMPPTWRDDLLPRERLVTRLARSVEAYRVTAVCAPAGYGKTTLLADYVRRSDRLCPWLRLEAADRDPSELLHALTRAVDKASERGEPASSGTARARVAERSSPYTELQVANLVAGRYTDTVIVLDDLHSVADSMAAMRVIRGLVRATPDYVRFLVSSRHDVRQALADLAPLDSAAPLDGVALRFTRSELERLLDRMAVPHDGRPSLSRELEACDGWPLAVTLALRSRHIADSPDSGSAQDAVAGTFSALMRTVLAGLGTADTRFLHDVAQLERITPDLCAVCLDDERVTERLARLASQNLFFDHRAGDDVYRLHDLVRRYLARESPSRRAFSHRQHRLAADWLEETGQPVFALRHRLAAGDHEAAASRLLTLAPDLAESGRWHTLVDLVHRVQEDGPLPASPDLARVVARAQVAIGDTGAARRTLSRALEEAAGDDREAAALLVSRSYAHRSHGDMPRAIADARAALASGASLHASERLKACRLLGQAHASELELAPAEQWFARAADLAREVDEPGARALLALDTSRFETMRGRFEDAIRLGRHAVHLADEAGNVDAALFARNNLASVLHLSGSYDEALRMFEAVETEALGRGHHRVAVFAWIGIGDVRDALQLDTAAESCYRRANALARESDEGDVIAEAHRALAARLRRSARLQEARRMLTRASRQAARDRYSEAQWGIEDAALSLAEGNVRLAESSLLDLVSVLEPSGARVLLAHAKLQMAHAVFHARGVRDALVELDALVEVLEPIGSHQFLLPACDDMPRLWGAVDAAGRPELRRTILEPDLRPRVSPQARGLPATAYPDDPHPRLLTPREREIVIALCEGRTRDQIADRMSLSRSTIDKAISTLYASTGFRHAHQLVAWSFRCKLFDPSDPPPAQTRDDPTPG